MKNIASLLIYFSFVICHLSFAQDESGACPTESGDAKKNFEKSRDKKKYNYQERIKFVEKALEEDAEYAPANYEMGMHWQRKADEADGSCTKCEQYFLAAVKSCPLYHSNPYFFLGKLYFEQEKYDSCITYMKKFLDFKEDDVKKYDKIRYDRFLVDAKRYMSWAEFYKETIGSPVPFDPKIVEGISTVKDEYLPFISPDNEIAFFTRRIMVEQLGMAWEVKGEKEFFCYSEKGNDGKFTTGEPMPTPPFNVHYNEGGASITINNKQLFYTVVENNGNYDIYMTEKVNGAWQQPKNLGPAINSPDYWDSQPSISADGRTLYFASNRPGGFGGIDIWKSEKDAAGNWQLPVNLGRNINTPGDEKSPFLHWDSRTLYFSSGDNEQAYTNHKTLGGFDIFYVRADNEGKWMKPKNIGYPINTSRNEVGFFVSSDGKYGYFASNDNQKMKGKSVGGYDLYYFELHKQARPDEIAIIKGSVNSEKGEQVVGEVELKDAVTNKVTRGVVDSATGEFAVAANVQKKHDQLLTVKKDGHAFSSQLIKAEDLPGDKPVETPEEYTLAKAETEGKNKATPDTAQPERTEEKKEELKKTEPEKVTEPVKEKEKPKVKEEKAFEKSPVIEVNMQLDSLKDGKAFTLNNIYFDHNRAELKNESRIVLDEFAHYLADNPKISIEIHGHTDIVGSPSDNQNLSAERAFTVFEYLRNTGVKKEQIKGYKGFGSTKPIASNDSEEGKAKNRRTEFLVFTH